MIDLALVFERTAAGRREIGNRRCGLTRDQRNLLIIADGVRPLSFFADMCKCTPQEMQAIVRPLLDQQLIVPVDVPQAGAGAPLRAAPAAPGSRRAALIGLARSLFGEHATAIVSKLERVPTDSVADLSAAVDASTKLARLTIDEGKAKRFMADARSILSGGD